MSKKQRFSDAKTVRVEKLIAEAEVFYTDRMSYIAGRDMDGNRWIRFDTSRREEYENWLRSVEDYIEKKGMEMPPAIFGTHNFTTPRPDYVLVSGEEFFNGSSHERSKDVQDDKFLKVLADQIGFLQTIKREAKKQIGIAISDDGLIENLANAKNHKYEVGDKRFKLIKYLAERGTSVKVSVLLKEIGYKDGATLSKEKREINRIFAGNLKIREFISRRGYRVNPRYEVILK